MELFDCIKAIFDKREFANIKDEDKANNFFILRRMMSVKYPMQCQFVNTKTINPVLGFNVLARILQTNKSIPKWMYDGIRGKKEKTIFDECDKKVVEVFYKHYDIDNNTLNVLMEYEPEKLKQILGEIDDMLKAKQSKRQRKNK